MIYTNNEVAKRDLEWLTQECTLSAFAASRLTHYELTMMENKLTDISDKAILAFYADLFETFKLKKPHWKKQVSEHMLRLRLILVQVSLLCQIWKVHSTRSLKQKIDY